MHYDPFMQRSHEVRRVLWVTFFLNIIVSSLKLGYGHLSGSLSMVADGFHSLLDSSSNIIGLIALLFAAKPADPKHPYGHRKAEAIAAMLISGLLFLACYEIASSAYQRFHTHTVPEVTWISFSIMIFTMGVNFWVSRYELRRGHELHSQILTADAAHTRSDLFASCSVILSLIAVQLHLNWMDLIAAFGISILVGYSGYKIILESLETLMDSAQLDPRMINDLVMSVPGVERCHHIRTRGHPSAIYMDLNIHLDPQLSLVKAHQLTHEVIEKIKKALPNVVDVVVHSEPSTPDHE